MIYVQEIPDGSVEIRNSDWVNEVVMTLDENDFIKLFNQLEGIKIKRERKWYSRTET